MRLIIIFICFLVGGCGFLERNTVALFDSNTSDQDQTASARSRAHIPAIQNETTSVSVDTIETAGNNSLIEVIWTVPTEPVDGFVIQYGESRERLDREIKISTNSLERFEDIDSRPLYRYVMGDIARDKPIYIAIASYRNNTTSALSAVYEVSPQ